MRMHASEERRGTFDGVAQILVYNWPFYAAAVAFDLVIVLALIVFAPSGVYRIAIYLVALPPTFWAVSSILVSYYVYDHSSLYRWEWLRPVLIDRSGAWLNIHAGLDQTTAPLLRIFPDAKITSLDIYRPSEMTEPSIARARRRAQAKAQPDADSSVLRFGYETFDTVLLIFAAHELRSREAKVELFREIHQVLKANGRMVLAEHLRDSQNFLAYGPGFLHFFSRSEWLSVADSAGMVLIATRSLTPFVQCFVLEKAVEAGAFNKEER
jgi:SAM-dependent methyltransferase